VCGFQEGFFRVKRERPALACGISATVMSRGNTRNFLCRNPIELFSGVHKFGSGRSRDKRERYVTYKLGESAMNSLMRRDPWSLMPRLQDDINQLFSNMNQNDSSSVTATWAPPVDVYEYPDRFEFYIDMPGVNPNAVELTLERGVLTLAGERPELRGTDQQAEPKSQRIERGHGRFHRRFVLPDTVDSEKVNATGKDGVLTVTIPKQPKAMPRRIRIAE
jgi:HSP20 family protein